MRALCLAAVFVCVGCAAPPKAPATLQHAVPAPEATAPEPPAPPASPPATSSLDSAPSAPSSPEPPSEPPPAATEPRPTANETRQCSARGGTIQPVCLSGGLACVVPYRDGGKRCSDKSDCTGQCLYEGPAPAPPAATGSCQRTNDPCGCKSPIHHGHVQSTVCLD
jgi:hypothetical protein